MRILIWHDKHGDEPYVASTRERLDKAALEILQARIDRDYLDSPDDAEERAEYILQQKDGAAALRFLQARSDEGYEYERISLVEAK